MKTLKQKRKKMKRLVQILCAVVLFSSLAQAAYQQSIKVVGSSTVYPVSYTHLRAHET